MDKELPTETDKIVFLQLGLNYFNKTNSLKIDGTRNTETEAAMQKFQADFDKKFPNAYKNPNENPFERTIHNLWFELSQAGFDTIKIIDESLRKSKTIPKQSQTTNAQTVAPKKENPSEMSQNTQKTPEVKQTKDNPENIATKTTSENTETPATISTNDANEKGTINTVTMDENAIRFYAKNPFEIANETMKIFYTQRALNIVKNNISETGAKALIAGQQDLELTGKMDDRTTKAIEAFQKYINHYKYHTPNEPLEVTGKLNIKTMEALIARINLTGNSQSEEIVRKSLQDIQK